MNDAQRELISAHFDGELDQEHRAEVERLLADDPTCRRWWDELAGMRDTLRGLPAMSADDDLADRVLRSAERAMFTDADQSDVEATEGAASRQLAAARGDIAAGSPRRSSWLVRRRRGLLWSAAAVAAALVVFVSISRDPDNMVALAPHSDSRLKESEPTRPSEPAERGDLAETATTELEAIGRSRRERDLAKSAPTGGDTLSSETLPSETPSAMPRATRAGQAGEDNMPRSAKGGGAGVGAMNEIEDRQFGSQNGAGGYGGAGYGDAGYGGRYGIAMPADERELKERFATAAANRTVYVVHVDVPTDAEGGEQLNELLAQQQVVTAPTGALAVEQQATQQTTARELKLNEALASDGDADDNGIDAARVSAEEPRYYYAEMTPAQLQAAVIDMRSQREVFSNVALSDTASNRIDVESLADTDLYSDAPDELSIMQSDRYEGAAGNFAEQKSAAVVDSLEQGELNDSTSEVLQIDQGAVVDLGQRAGGRKNLYGLGQQLSHQTSTERLDDIVQPDEDIALEENGVVDAPVTDPVVQQVIVEGQQALSEWRFQNVIVGQQVVPPASVSAIRVPAINVPALDTPALNAAAPGENAADTSGRAPAGSANDKDGDKAEGHADTDAPATAPSRAIGAMQQQRSIAQTPDGSSLLRSRQAAGAMLGVQAHQQDAGLVGTLFILRFTEGRLRELPSDESAESAKPDAAEPADAGDE